MKNTSQTAKNVGYRVFAAILAAFAVGIFFLPCVTNVVVGSSITLSKGFLYKTVITLFNGEAPRSLFNVLPAIYDPSNSLGLFANCIFYFFLLCTVIAFVLSVIAIFCKKKSPALLRTATYFFAVGCVLFAVSEFTYYYRVQIFEITEIELLIHNIFLLAPAFVLVLFYFVLACIKLRKTMWRNILNGLLSLIVFCALAMVIEKDMSSIALALYNFGLRSGAIWDIIELALCGALILNFLLSAMHFIQKKGIVLCLIRYIIMLLIAGFVLYAQIAKDWRSTIIFILAIVAAAAALIQVVVCILQIVFAKKAKKKALKEAQQEPVEEVKEEPAIEVEEPATPAVETAPVEEVYIREEYAEAVSYDGGVVEGVEMAEIVEEEPVAVATEPAPVETADYDYYNSKSFDPFIATLSTEERNQFTELYIMKCKGTMPEIPDYEVGGNNKQFFRKVFIYLGQYRDRIPEGLLSKIYEFAIKL